MRQGGRDSRQNVSVPLPMLFCGIQTLPAAFYENDQKIVRSSFLACDNFVRFIRYTRSAATSQLHQLGSKESIHLNALNQAFRCDKPVSRHFAYVSGCQVYPCGLPLSQTRSSQAPTIAFFGTTAPGRRLLSCNSRTTARRAGEVGTSATPAATRRGTRRGRATGGHGSRRKNDASDSRQCIRMPPKKVGASL
jgi:hypothetical protein